CRACSDPARTAMSTSPLLEQLIEALRCLPGVGRKSAQRMAYHLLERDREGGLRLAGALAAAAERGGPCEQCRDVSETPVCPLCAIESPADRLAIETATGYRGLYFVLQGRLSPLDGIGPRELGLDTLAERLAGGEVRELIIATNPTVEGEATAHYLAQLARQAGVQPSRHAHGLPRGGELEYGGPGTLAQIFGFQTQILHR